MAESNVKVSVFTPTHNPKFLQDAYDAMKDQPFHEWVIVYNNGAQPLEFNDPRVKAFTLLDAPGWVGPLKAYACEQCTGDVLLELDHDDWLLPGAIEECQKAFEDPDVGFAYSNTVSDPQQISRFTADFGWKYRDFLYKGKIYDECISFEPTPEAVSRIWFAPNHFRAFRKTVYDKIGGYNKGMRVLDDQDIMSRMFLNTKFKFIDKPLYFYRVHGENTWLVHNAEIQNNVLRIYDQYIEGIVDKWATDKNLGKIELGDQYDFKPGGFTTVGPKNTDIICDLNEKWPFEDSSVGVLRAVDILEHLKDPVHIMKEASRVLIPGGWFLIRVPSTDGRGAFQDPTHITFWNENSFLYYCNKNFAKYIGMPVKFQAVGLFTTEKDPRGVCWVRAHLVNMKDDYRPCGPLEI